jgi:hypothetical protein
MVVPAVVRAVARARRPVTNGGDEVIYSPMGGGFDGLSLMPKPSNCDATVFQA